MSLLKGQDLEPASFWANPNNNVWQIKEISDGISIHYIDTPILWWNSDDHIPEGYNPWDFRGAIIKYHAYSSSSGTTIGEIIIANDVQNSSNVHTEVISGNTGNNNIFWNRIGIEKQLHFSASVDSSVLIQWKATTFWGQEYYC